MSRSFLIAAILNWAVVAALAGVGIDYLTSKTVKPHHRQVLDVTWESLTPGTQALIMTLMKGTGLVALVTAISMATVLCGPFRERSPWSRPALMIIAGSTLLPTLLATLHVRSTTGADAPWWPHVAMTAALAIAYWLTRDFIAPQLPKDPAP
jgi:hypothetical protein